MAQALRTSIHRFPQARSTPRVENRVTAPVLAVCAPARYPCFPLKTLWWKASAPPPAMKNIEHRDFTLSPEDNARLANLCGPFDGHLRQILSLIHI